MKRFAIIAVLVLLLGWSVSAQVGGYADTLKVGDTIDLMQRRPGYFYHNWWADRWADTTHGRLRIGYHQGLRYNYTSRPLKVVGIAGVISMTDYINPFITVDTTDTQEYFLLCDAMPDTFMIVAKVPFHARDPRRYARVLQYGEFTDRCCRNSDIPDTLIYKFYTYFFDVPVFVQDSFYVGATENCKFALDYPRKFDFTTLSLQGPYYDYANPGSIGDCVQDSCRHIPPQKYRAYDIAFYTEGGDYNMMFPIVEPDSCHPMKNIRIVSVGSGRAQLMWEADFQHIGWEVAWGMAGTSPDSCTVITCDTSSVIIEGIQADSHYVAYVRGACEFMDSVYYGDWSAGTDIFYASRYRVEVVANVPERGRVTGGGEYTNGETVTITASPWSQYGFLQWNDGDTSNPRRFVVTQDTMFTAIFVSHESIMQPDGAEIGVQLQPNPASGQVKVACTCRMTAIEVVDAQGRIVLVQQVDGETTLLDISQLSAGSYVVQVRAGQVLATRRLVVE